MADATNTTKACQQLPFFAGREAKTFSLPLGRRSNIAFEYPSGQRQQMIPFVIRAAAILDLAENDGCDKPATSVAPER
jgi:hypothetical protein